MSNHDISTPEKRILIVVSSYGKDGGKTRPGYEFDEFSQAYLIFTSNGFAVDVASPRGGAVESDEFNKTKPYNKALLVDEKAMSLLKTTKPTASLRAENYDAVYVVGGKGAMFDLPFDPALQELLASVYNSKNGIVSAVCHGPAALVNVKRADGQYLLAGKTVSGFCNLEEEKFGKRWREEFPFMLEDKLKARGGKYERAEMMLPHVSVSEKLITGQNPYSTNAVAEELVKALGKQPAPRTPYVDERSMYLVKQAIAGELEWAKTELKNSKELYDVELIALYGYYRLLGKNNDAAVTQMALNIVELATPYMYNENLQFEQARGYLKLQQKDRAKALLQDLVKKEPKFEEAKKLLSEVE
jgi:putative intracellular protease/amidase